MTDPLERELTLLFKDRAESAPPPTAPVEHLRREGEAAEHRKRQLPILAGAAATALFVVGLATITGLTSNTSDPGPADPLGPDSTNAPLRNAPQVPHINDSVLYAGTAEVLTQADQVFAAGDSVLVTDHYYDQEEGERTRAHALVGDKLVPLPMLDDASAVNLSQGGEWVAAVSYPTPDTTRVSLYRFPEGTDENSVDLPIPGSCCGSGPVDLIGVDASGRVFLNTNGSESFVWNPDVGRPVPVDGAPGLVEQVTEAGVISVPGRYGLVAERVLGDVDESGRFRARLTIPIADPTDVIVWSPSGTSAAYYGRTGAVLANLDEEVSEVRLDLEGREFSRFLVFESETNVLLVARSGNRNTLLRCEPSGDCEQIQDLGGVNGLDNWTFPRR